VAIIAAEQRGEQQATPAEKTEEEIEEDKYREMQNFDEYSKIKTKISKLTLASLMKGNLNARAHARVCVRAVFALCCCVAPASSPTGVVCWPALC